MSSGFSATEMKYPKNDLIARDSRRNMDPPRR
jgi:hypothetical protein